MENKITIWCMPNVSHTQNICEFVFNNRHDKDDYIYGYIQMDRCRHNRNFGNVKFIYADDTKVNSSIDIEEYVYNKVKDIDENNWKCDELWQQ
jgi:hypothetical protein